VDLLARRCCSTVRAARLTRRVPARLLLVDLGQPSLSRLMTEPSALVTAPLAAPVAQRSRGRHSEDAGEPSRVQPSRARADNPTSPDGPKIPPTFGVVGGFVSTGTRIRFIVTPYSGDITARGISYNPPDWSQMSRSILRRAVAAKVCWPSPRRSRSSHQRRPTPPPPAAHTAGPQRIVGEVRHCDQPRADRQPAVLHHGSNVFRTNNTAAIDLDDQGLGTIRAQETKTQSVKSGTTPSTTTSRTAGTKPVPSPAPPAR
jgi:hypothetical protein